MRHGSIPRSGCRGHGLRRGAVPEVELSFRTLRPGAPSGMHQGENVQERFPRLGSERLLSSRAGAGAADLGLARRPRGPRRLDALPPVQSCWRQLPQSARAGSLAPSVELEVGEPSRRTVLRCRAPRSARLHEAQRSDSAAPVSRLNRIETAHATRVSEGCQEDPDHHERPDNADDLSYRGGDSRESGISMPSRLNAEARLPPAKKNPAMTPALLPPGLRGSPPPAASRRTLGRRWAARGSARPPLGSSAPLVVLVASSPRQPALDLGCPDVCEERERNRTEQTRTKIAMSAVDTLRRSEGDQPAPRPVRRRAVEIEQECCAPSRSRARAADPLLTDAAGCRGAAGSAPAATPVRRG